MRMPCPHDRSSLLYSHPGKGCQFPYILPMSRLTSGKRYVKETYFCRKAGPVNRCKSSGRDRKHRMETPDSESAISKKRNKFFRGFARRRPFDHDVRKIGTFTQFSVSVPGDSPGSYTRWVKVVNLRGKTVRMYHDTYDKTGRFIHRGVKIPRPERHVI